MPRAVLVLVGIWTYIEAPAGQMDQMFSFVFFLARFENTRHAPGWSLGQRNGRPATWVDLAGIDPRDQTQGI